MSLPALPPRNLDRHTHVSLGVYLEEMARTYAGQSGDVFVRPGKCSVTVCGLPHQSGDLLRMEVTERASDDVPKYNKVLMERRRGRELWMHRGAASISWYLYRPGYAGPLVVHFALRRACDVNLSRMQRIIEVPPNYLGLIN